MNTLRKMLLVFFTMAVIISFSSLQTFAADVEQNNIKFSFKTEKESYAKNENISVILEISNNGKEDVTDLEWVNALPSGYEFVDANLEKQTVDVIHPNEALTLNAKMKLKVSDSIVDDPKSAPTTNNNQGTNVVQTGTSSNVVAICIVVALLSLIVFISLRDRKKSSKVLSFMLCIALVVGAVPASYVSAVSEEDAETTRYQVRLEENVTVENEILTLTSTVDYSLPTVEKEFNEKYYDDDKTFTRGEWVAALSDKLGIEPVEFPEGYDFFYGDSIDSEYGALVETALGYSLLPAPDSEGYIDPKQDIPMFEADKIATREFVAYTVAKSMGFEGEYTLNSADVDLVKYTNEVAVVVNQKFMSLINNEFKPANAVTGTDINKVLNRIDYFNDSLLVEDSKEKDIVKYQNGVVKLNEEYTTTVSEEVVYTVEFTKKLDNEAVVAGAVIILPANDEYLSGIALKVKEVKAIDDKTVLICEETKIEEVVQNFDYAGHGNVVAGDIVAADGVEVEYNPNGIIDEEDSSVNAFDVGGSISSGTLTYTLRKKEIKDGLTASGKVAVSIPDITAKAKGKVIGGFELEELTLTVADKLKVSGELEYDFGIPKSGYHVTTGKPKFGSGKTELGRVPFALGATGFTIDLVFFVNLDVSGKLSISYAIERTNGIQYKDGAFRNIKEYGSEFTALELNGSAKLGVGMVVRLTYLSVFELVGIDVHSGVGVSIGFTVRLDCDPNLYCGDARIYLYLTLELDKDTIVGFVLENLFDYNKGGVELSWGIFDEDHSPFKKVAHIENMRWVDDCTYGKGSLLGVVKDKATGEKIGGAQVKIYNKTNGRLVKSGYTRTTDAILSDNTILKGEYFVQNLPAGTYQFEVKTTGYKKAIVDVDVVKGQRVVCEATLMIAREDLEGVGVVLGSITDACTGSTVLDVKYDVRSGLNTKVGDVIATGIVSDNYSIELEPGYYSILFTKNGFVDELISVTINADNNTTKNVALAPTSNITIDDSSFRVVLTWGEYPSDLDSHMYYDADDGLGFHTYYSDKNHYENDDMVANLDLDDRTSYGPETSTVYQVKDNGVYSFYVHDYTNKYSKSSTAMSSSGAQVKIFSGSILVATLNIPENRGGTLWHVFDYESATGEFDYVNEFSYAVVG